MIKVELFRDNPTEEKLADVFETLERHSLYPTQTIRNHLERIHSAERNRDLGGEPPRVSPSLEGVRECEMAGLEYMVSATDENFDEQQYVWANPDIEVAIIEGRISSGTEHFFAVGKHEGRKLFRRETLFSRERAKTARIAQELLRETASRILRADGTLDFLTAALREMAGVVQTTAVSANDYDPIPKDWIENYPDAWILDAGAGYRGVYFDNVVNFEIVEYPPTDVLGVGESLPFKNDCFDFVISNAVLEYVYDPFTCANELTRVLKPRGQIFCAVPFLQPFHAYPNHYYNMTHQGLKNLFVDCVEITRLWVPSYFHPMFVVSWIVNSWMKYLDDSAKAAFVELKVGELVEISDEFAKMTFNQIDNDAFMFELVVRTQRMVP
jgi:predicted SAM-dependent methyltransferase